MNNRQYLSTALVFLFLSSFFLPTPWSDFVIIVSILSITIVAISQWIKIVRLEPYMLIKFKTEFNNKIRAKENVNSFLIVSGIILITFLLIRFGPEYLYENNFDFDSSLWWPFIILLNVSNLVYFYRYHSCFLTNEGIFDSRSFEEINLTDYDEYHYEPKHNSFILSKDGVETMELIAKTPIEPYESVLIDWFENQLDQREKIKE